MSTINFDMDALNSLIENEDKFNSGKFGNSSKTNISFLKEGNHKIRIIIDPDKQLYRQIVMHNIRFRKEGEDDQRVKCLCPNHLNMINKRNPKWAETVQSYNPEWRAQNLKELPECEICKLAESTDNWRLGISPKYYYMIYMVLYETSNADDYWVPKSTTGNLYAVMGNSKTKNTLMEVSKDISTSNPDYILKTLNPELEGGLLTMTVVRGTQGTVNISFVPGKTKPALFHSDDSLNTTEEREVKEQWRPLSELYISSEFNYNDYKDAVELTKKVLEADNLKSKKKTESPSGTVPQSGSTGGNQIGSGDSGNAGSTQKASTTPTETVTTINNPISDNIVTASSSQQNQTTPPQSSSNVITLKKVDGFPDDKTITLPENVVKAGCWGSFDTSKPECFTCNVNIDCMTLHNLRTQNNHQ